MWQVWEFLEFFAGVGNLTKMATAAHCRSARFDLLDNIQSSNHKSMLAVFVLGFGVSTSCFARSPPNPRYTIPVEQPTKAPPVHSRKHSNANSVA